MKFKKTFFFIFVFIQTLSEIDVVIHSYPSGSLKTMSEMGLFRDHTAVKEDLSGKMYVPVPFIVPSISTFPLYRALSLYRM